MVVRKRFGSSKVAVYCLVGCCCVECVCLEKASYKRERMSPESIMEDVAVAGLFGER